MKNKLIYYGITILFFISIIGNVMALDEQGFGKQNQNFTFEQSCSNADYITIGTIQYPDRSSQLINANMTSVGGGVYQYNITNTSQLGRYDIKGESNGCEETFATYFEVTPSGFIDTLGLYLIFLIILMSIVVLGFSIQEAYFVILGGMGLIMLGIYSINYGVVGFKDMFMTWGMGLFEIAVGAILSIGSGIQKMDED